MIRLFVEETLKEGIRIVLPEKQGHYLRHVMRLEAGKEVALFNGKDGEWTAVLSYPTKKESVLQVQHQTREQIYLKPCALAFALIKKENTALILQKATELGVTHIYPLITKRTIIRSLNRERAEMIIQEAAEQCERVDIPQLHPVMDLRLFVKDMPQAFTPVHLAERATVSDTLTPDMAPLFIVGPEGGFTPDENALIAQMPQVKIVHLGETVLRAETAALAILSAWQFRLF